MAHRVIQMTRKNRNPGEDHVGQEMPAGSDALQASKSAQSEDSGRRPRGDDAGSQSASQAPSARMRSTPRRRRTNNFCRSRRRSAPPGRELCLRLRIEFRNHAGTRTSPVVLQKHVDQQPGPDQRG